MYIVTQIRMEMSPRSKFPNDFYQSFMDYYQDRYEQKIYNIDQPLLLVKGLSKRFNLLKPRGRENKRRREKVYEELAEELIPELLVKQTFPACLWIQASFLPSVLSRISYLLQLEELRNRISVEMKLAASSKESWAPLVLDKHLLHYVPEEGTKPDNKGIFMVTNQDPTVLALPSSSLVVFNKDYAMKRLESEYPWKDLDEPKDLERVLENVTPMDVEYYERFIGRPVSEEDRVLKNVVNSPSRCLPAITYDKVSFI